MSQATPRPWSLGCADGPRTLVLHFGTRTLRVKFFPGGPRSDLLAGIREVLGVAEDAPLRFRDAGGDIVLVTPAGMPSGTVLHAAVEWGVPGEHTPDASGTAPDAQPTPAAVTNPATGITPAASPAVIACAAAPGTGPVTGAASVTTPDYASLPIALPALIPAVATGITPVAMRARDPVSAADTVLGAVVGLAEYTAGTAERAAGMVDERAGDRNGVAGGVRDAVHTAVGAVRSAAETAKEGVLPGAARVADVVGHAKKKVAGR